jgi:hypothetical protein
LCLLVQSGVVKAVIHRYRGRVVWQYG